MQRKTLVATILLVALGALPLATASARGLAGGELGRRKLTPAFRHDKGDVKVAFFDADLTVRSTKSGAPTPNSPTDLRLMPYAARGIAKLNRQGYLVAIVSNQGGIPEYISLKDADRALGETVRRLGRLGARVDYYDFAEKSDRNRKPGTGMAERLARVIRREFNVRLDKKRSLMVGDAAYRRADAEHPADTRPDGKPGTNFSNSDRLFAENYGIRFIEAIEFRRSAHRLGK